MTRTTGQGLLIIESGDPSVAIEQGMPTGDSVDAALARLLPANLADITAIRDAINAALAATPTLAAAAVAAALTPAIAAALAGSGIPQAIPVDDPAVVFAITDSAGRRSWLELSPSGGITANSLSMINAAIAPGIATAVAGLPTSPLAITDASTAMNDVAFAVTDSAGRRSDLELGLDGKLTQRSIDSIGARLNVGPGSAERYVPEIVGTTPNRSLYINDRTLATRTLITATGDPSSARLSKDNITVIYTTSAGERYARLDGVGGELGPVTGTYAIATFGDSTTDGTGSAPGPVSITHSPKWPARVGTLLGGVTVNNYGRGGLGPAEVAITQGGHKPALTVTGNTIPASGPVDVTHADTTGWRISAGISVTQTGTLAGIPGTFYRMSDGTLQGSPQTFTRTTPGSAVACPPGTLFYPTQQAARRDDIQTIMVGRNNMDIAPLLANVAAMVAHLRPLTPRFLVMGPFGASSEINPSAGYTALKAIHAALAAAYGPRYYDLHSAFVAGALAALTAGGITPTATDISNVAAGGIPPSMVPDNVHFTQLGANLTADLVAARLRALGWFA